MPVKIERRQFALRLAWSGTTHRVQGDNLDGVLIDSRQKPFANGMTYVDTSRGHTREQTRFLLSKEYKSVDGNSFRIVNVVNYD